MLYLAYIINKTKPTKQFTPIKRPIITEPTNNTTNFYGTVKTSPFTVDDTIKKQIEHISSDWEIATDSNFTNIVWSSYDDTENLTELSLAGNNIRLNTNTKYYVRVRHNSKEYKSEWSYPISFTTGVDVPPLITIDWSPGRPYNAGLYDMTIITDKPGNITVTANCQNYNLTDNRYRLVLREECVIHVTAVDSTGQTSTRQIPVEVVRPSVYLNSLKEAVELVPNQEITYTAVRYVDMM